MVKSKILLTGLALSQASNLISAKKVRGLDLSEISKTASNWWTQLQTRIQENLKDKNAEQLFEKLAKKFKKVYKDKECWEEAFQNFAENLEEVKKNPNLTIWNEFFDMNKEEYGQFRLTKTMKAEDYHNNPTKRKLLEPVAGGAYWPIDIPDWIKDCADTDAGCGLGSIEFPWECMPAPDFENTGIDYPATVDWTTRENPLELIAVTPVKDQGICGSCYSFAGTGALEGLMLREKKVSGSKTKGGLKKNKRTWQGLSEQEIINCMDDNRRKFGPFVNHGCNGGWPSNVFLYSTVREAIRPYENLEFPYVSGDNKNIGECSFADKTLGASENAFSQDFIPGICYSTEKDNEQQLMRALYHHGPIAVIIDASTVEFQLYKTGILDPAGCSKNSLNHAVLLVGYGEEENGEKFWKIKNSWGDWWGDEGYVKLARNGENTCGVTSVATYVTSENYYD